MKRILLLFVLLLSVVFYGRAQTLQKADVMQLVSANSDAIGITKEQVGKLRLSAAYSDAGIQYVYLIQTVQKVPVNQQMLVLAFRNSKLISKSGSYNADFEQNNAPASPSKTASDAVNLAFLAAKVPAPAIGSGTSVDGNPDRINYGKLPGVTDNVIAQLMWQPVMQPKTLGNTFPIQGGKTDQPVGLENITNPSGITREGTTELVELGTPQNNGNNPGSDPRFDLSKIPVIKDNNATGTPVQNQNMEQALRLVWQVQVTPAGSSDNWLIQIDATTGAVFSKTNLTIYETGHEGHNHIDNTGVVNRLQRPGRVNAQNNLPPPSVTSGTYNVIPLYFESPNHTPFKVVTSPWENAGVGSNATTHGWHYDGTTNYDSTRGNNVSAYLDLLRNNTPGGNNRMARSATPSPSLSFNFPHAPADPASSEGNRNVALTNLFYWNNILHDMTYQYGFNEVGGNFQNDNIGRGGSGDDYMRAEAQDASGTNNANYNGSFSDGTTPRIQMFLFTTGGTKSNLTVNSPSAIAGDYTMVESNFSNANKLINVGPVTARVVYFMDANGTANQACTGRPLNDVDGKIALINRGGCDYVTKVKQAQDAGAVAVIVINNTTGAPLAMGGADNRITIPAVMVSDVDGAKLAAQLNNNVNATLSAIKLPDNDGDLDNGIIIHEYVHGVSSRITGGPVKASTCLSNAEQGGEGWSDYYALMLTTDWSKATVNDGAIPRGVGTFASGEPTTGEGIREVPYSTDMSVDPLTYSHVQTANGQVHRIGTLWCSALWDMTWDIIQQENTIEADMYKYDAANKGGNMIAFKLVQEGLRLQPCQPGFLDARDAIIQADMNLYGGRHVCTIWKAFARRGMGYSAVQGSSNSISDQVQAFDLPPAAKFTMQPADVLLCAGGSATFTATATVPMNPVTFQWEKSTDGGNTWTAVTGATGMSVTINPVTTADNGAKFRLVATSTNACNAGTVASNIATLTVIATPVGGSLSPATAGTCGSASSSGRLTLSGHAGSVIRWERSTNGGTSWTNIANTTTTLDYNVTVNTMYRVFVQGSGCATGAYSSVATVSVNTTASSMTIVADPGTMICEGDPTKLTLMEGAAGSVTSNLTFTTLAAVVTFNFRNNNTYPVLITDISSVVNNIGLADSVSVYYKTSAINGAPGAISPANGWNPVGNATITGTNSIQPFLSGTSLVVPAGATYGFAVQALRSSSGAGDLVYNNGSGNQTISSAGCDLITGPNIGYGGTSPIPAAPTITVRRFIGSVRFTALTSSVSGGTFSWTPAAGLNATNTAIVAASPMVNTTYTATHDNGAGCVRKASVSITVLKRPAITKQPVNTTACENSDVTFTVEATGNGLTYQWERSTDNCITYTPITGATAAKLTLSSLTVGMNGNGFRCKITGTCSPVITTNCAILTISAGPTVAITPTGTICGGQQGISGTLLSVVNPQTSNPDITYTWTPAQGLYTDSRATVPYVAGAQATAVYAAPSVPTTYAANATFISTGCTSKAQVAVVNTPSPFITQFESPICLGGVARLINRTPNATKPVWSPANGLFTDANATVPYIAGSQTDTVWAKPATAPASVNVNMSSLIQPNTLLLSNRGTTGASTVTFNIRNNNLYPVTLNEVSGIIYPALITIGELWYKPQAINGPTGAISTANGWTSLGIVAVPPDNSNLNPQPIFTGLTQQIPANTTFGFAISSTSFLSGNSGIVISNTGANTISSAGAVDLISAPGVTYAGASPAPAEPAIAGYYFAGGIKITPVVSPPCTAPATAKAINVHAPVTITSQPVSTAACKDKAATFTTVTTGDAAMHNWRVSANGGLTWTDVVNNTLYSGAKTATLTITAPPLSMTGYQYKDSITTPACGGIVSNTVTLSVNNLPAPAIVSSDLTITPGQTTTITATSTPAAAANGWAWTLNGTAITGSGNTQTVGINQLGVYQARVIDANGCSALSNELVIGAEGSDRLWIYPNPNNGVFNVRLYFDNTLVSDRRVVTIYDMLGQRVARQEFALTNLTPPYLEMKFDMSKMAAGTYLLKVTDRFTSNKASGLVVIQH